MLISSATLSGARELSAPGALQALTSRRLSDRPRGAVSALHAEENWGEEDHAAGHPHSRGRKSWLVLLGAGGRGERPPPEARMAGAPAGHRLEAAPLQSHLSEVRWRFLGFPGYRHYPSRRFPEAASRFILAGTVASTGHTAPRCSQDW